MNRRSHLWSSALAVPFVLWPALRLALAQEAPATPVARNASEMKLSPVPGLPTCAPGAVQTGDPRKGPSIVFGSLAAGCAIPSHWHTPNEHLMIVSGEAQLQAKGGTQQALRAGSFALMPGHHVHQFRCTTVCQLFVYSDGAFDIHYVNAQGKEISADDALKAVKEIAAKPPSKTK